MNPKDQGFTIVALVHSPEQDLTDKTLHFTAAQTRPLSGTLQTIIKRKTIDVAFIRGTSAYNLKCAPLINFFSDPLTNDDSKALEHLMDLSSKSQR